MKTNEFIHRIENGEAKVLTVEEAKKLKGKKIYWFYFGYSGKYPGYLRSSMPDELPPPE